MDGLLKWGMTMHDTVQKVLAQEDYKIRLEYQDGVTVIVDFSPVIQEGGIFSTLADPDFFKQVRLGDRRRSIIWPGELDFCADALRLEGQVVNRNISSAA